MFTVINVNNLSLYSTGPEEDHVERFDNIIKPPRDNRMYRGLKLRNELKILLISDPATKKSGASMTLRVGKFQTYNFKVFIPG